MVATLTTALGILKEVYEGDINNQLVEEKVLMKRIESSTSGVFENAGGKYVVFPVRTARNQGISYRTENQQLGAAGQQGYRSTQEVLKYGYGRCRMTGQLMELAETNAQAFANAADAEMSGLKEDVVRDSNRIAWGAYQGVVGITGIISRVTAAGAAVTTITAPVGSHIAPGMVIDVVDNVGTVVAGGGNLTVTSAQSFAASFTVSAAVTTAIGNNIVRAGDVTREPNGIMGLVGDTGTIHNINSGIAGGEFWRSFVDATTTTLTEAAMIKACDEIRRRSSKRPTAIFASLGVRRAYFNLCIQLRRYNEPKEFSGGLIGLAFNYEKELPVVTDIDAPDKTMVFLCEPEIKEYRTKPWYFAANDGSIFKYVMDFDAWEVLLKQYWQLCTHQRNAHAKMTNITEA